MPYGCLHHCVGSLTCAEEELDLCQYTCYNQIIMNLLYSCDGMPHCMHDNAAHHCGGGAQGNKLKKVFNKKV